MYLNRTALFKKEVAQKKGQPHLANPLILLEAASGFEPLNKGFADLCLTTWLRRRKLLPHPATDDADGCT